MKYANWKISNETRSKNLISFSLGVVSHTGKLKLHSSENILWKIPPPLHFTRRVALSVMILETKHVVSHIYEKHQKDESTHSRKVNAVFFDVRK